MAKGHDQFVARQQKVSRLGREISRRAKSKCELCGTQARLKVMELQPLPEEPDPDWAILLCPDCQPFVDPTAKISNPQSLQFLHDVVWSDILPVQVTAVRLTRRLDSQKIDWASAILDGLYLAPETEELL